jgi:acetyltransferase-like isoleucine patch superfamily enzyme
MVQLHQVMISIKLYILIGRVIYFSILKKIWSKIYRSVTNIGIHHSVRFYGSGKIFIGTNTYIDENVDIYTDSNSKLFISEGCTISSFCRIVLSGDDVIEIDENCSFQKRCELHGNIFIGKFNLFAPNCFMSSRSHNFAGDKRLTIREKDKIIKRKKIVIGDDCWIGINSVILPNSDIGSKCVIGANVVFSGKLGDKKIVKNSINKIEDIKYS